jgi:uncharacterized protein (TIRG00374 family)
MRLNRGRIINIAVSTILLALFLYLAFRNVNFNELVEILETTNYLYVFIGVFIGAIGGSIVRSLRWGLMLAPIKPNIPFRSLFSTTIIGYMVNNLIPRSGEVVRPYLLGKHEGISRTSAFATIIIERIIDTVQFLLIFGVALIFFKGSIASAIPGIGSAVTVLAALTFLLTFWIIFTMFWSDKSLKIIKFFTGILPARLHERVDKMFASLVEGFSILRNPKLLLKIGMYSILLWIIYLLGTYIPFYSFDIMTGTGNLASALWDANLLLVLINVAMFVPSPAATGPYHWICKVTLMSVFSVSEPKALGYGTATHAMSFLIMLVAGLYYFITSQYKFSELKEGTEQK